MGTQKTEQQPIAKMSVLASKNTWMEQAALDQLQGTARLSGMRYVVGMPDLHPGKGQPVGAAFMTRNCIYPHLVGSDIGCGMGLWKLDQPRHKLKHDKWLKRLTDLDDPEPGVTDQMGTIGGGNHFAEIQQIEDIANPELMQALELDKDALVLLVHSGSRGHGQRILQDYVSRRGGEPIRIEEQEEWQTYLQQHDQAVAWAIRNRAAIAERFAQRLKVTATPLLDEVHNTVTPLAAECLQHLAECEPSLAPYNDAAGLWIHRKGANPVAGRWVVIAGSRGSLSYLVRPKHEMPLALARGGFSLAHGAGRKWKRTDAKARLMKGQTVKALQTTALGSRVICEKRDLLFEEAPQAYKPIDRVIADLVAADMIEIVARLRPVITYKTRRR